MDGACLPHDILCPRFLSLQSRDKDMTFPRNYMLHTRKLYKTLMFFNVYMEKPCQSIIILVECYQALVALRQIRPSMRTF